MDWWETILGIVAGLGLSALLARQFLDAMASRRARRPPQDRDPGQA